MFKGALRIYTADFDEDIDTDKDQIERVPKITHSKIFHLVWACYPKRESAKNTPLATVKLLNILLTIGNVDKVRKLTADRADRADISIIEESTHSDWNEKVLATESRIKPFF